MKAKTKFLIFPIFLGLILGMVFSINNVNAQSYYNWIVNPSFVTYNNYCEDSGFESGSLESGVIYGNWSGDSETISTDNPNTGIYSARFSYNINPFIYVFSSEYNNTLGADIQKFSWYQYGSTTADYDLIIYYSDGSNTTYDGSADYGEYTKIDITDEIEDSKYIWKFGFYYQTGSGTSGIRYFDDFIFLVDDGGGQDSIVFGGNNDWQLGQTSDDTAPNFGYLDTTLGRLDNTSCKMNTYTKNHNIIQYIDFLDSDMVHYINLYVYGADIAYNEGLKIRLLYSDGSIDEKTVYVTGDGSSWEELNFGKNWIDSNKYISLIYIFGTSSMSYWIFSIDDVGIWCSIPYGYSKFAFTISPYPIEKGSYDFDAYSQTIYTFTGYFYNVTDLSLSINGTYQLSDSFGLHVGNMTNGLFSLQLNKRTYTGSPYTLEYLSITIITEYEIFNVDIGAYWYPVSGEIEIPDVDVSSDLILNFFMYGIFFLAIPLTVSVSVGGATNSSLGITTFIGAETLMGAIGLSIGLIDLWFMAVIIIIDAVIIVTMLRGK